MELRFRGASKLDSEGVKSRIDGLLRRADTEWVSDAMKVIPKRVIFWTTPYKQLYKDPAILVCVNDELIRTIDRSFLVQLAVQSSVG
jgi:hypothetical protein